MAEDSGVGVLGWLGFVIVNVAAWGIISVSAGVFWGLGLVVILAYLAVLIGMAVFLRRQEDAKFKAFENLLWVLACSFIFVLGMYLTFNLVAPAFGGGGGAGGLLPSRPEVDPINDDLAKILPETATPSLKAWAAESFWGDNQDTPTQASFANRVFFSGQIPSEGKGEYLLESDIQTTLRVDPPLVNPRNMILYASRLYLLAGRDSGSPSQGLWAIGGATRASASAVLVKDLDEYSNARHLAMFDGRLYLKVEYWCPLGTTYSILSTDGTQVGFQNLRPQKCYEPPNGNGTDTGGGGEGNATASRNIELWSIILLAAMPMVAVAAGVFWLLRLPGVFGNIYVGVAVVIGLLYAIIVSPSDSIGTFLKWFLTLYTGLSYVALAAASLLKPNEDDLESGSESRSELWDRFTRAKDWIAFFACTGFFIMIHIVLEIPATDGAGPWLAYAALIVVQGLGSVLVDTTLPLVLTAICTFVLAWKVSREVVRLLFGDSLDEQQMLVLLAIFALQGIGIIAGAVFYTSRRENYSSSIRTLLRKPFVKDKPGLLTVERNCGGCCAARR